MTIITEEEYRWAVVLMMNMVEAGNEEDDPVLDTLIDAVTDYELIHYPKWLTDTD
jgi:hypothetical protein